MITEKRLYGCICQQNSAGKVHDYAPKRPTGRQALDWPTFVWKSSLCMQINCAWFCQGISINLALDIAVEETLFTAISYDELLGRDSNWSPTRQQADALCVTLQSQKYCPFLFKHPWYLPMQHTIDDPF